MCTAIHIRRLSAIAICAMLSLGSQAQTVCATATENASLTLTAPAGNRLAVINFASYGTPTGSCGAFVTGSCHSATSVAVAIASFVNKTTFTIVANNATFGDPCVGTVKRLYVQATYQAILPLKLVSFTARSRASGEIILNWKTDEEINTKSFDIEQSEDGSSFHVIGNIAAQGEGSNNYQFITRHTSDGSLYYRLRMIDIDGKSEYSNIARYSGGESDKFSVTHDISGRKVIITSDKTQQASIFQANGQVVKKLMLVPGTQTISLHDMLPGLYIVATSTATRKLLVTQ